MNDYLTLLRSFYF
jgi:hypothetical protein